MPTPRFATRRRPERETWGGLAGIIAAQKLGRPLFPAQQYVCDVALEIDNETRGLAYDVVLFTVPRQTGKTTGVLFPVYVLRCTMWGIRQMCVYTAQDRNSARRKFQNDFLEILSAAPGYVRGVDYRVREANGSEEIYWPSSRSKLWISATNPSSGHGDALDMPGLDEIFEHHDLEVDQGFNPPMVTRPDAQKWLLSTAGTRRSVYLKDKREIGRRAVADDTGLGFAHFEWSAGDPGSDEDWSPEWVHDRSKWWHVMPALGHTQTEAKVASQLQELGVGPFIRAFGNLDDDGDDDQGSPIDLDEWSALVLEPEQVGTIDRIMLGVEVAKDRSSATIGMAGTRDAGGYLVEVIDSRPGTRWVPERLAELSNRHSAEGVAIDPSGPAGSLIADVEALGLDVKRVSGRAAAQACGALVDRVPTGEIFHLGQQELDGAVVDARTRALGEAWVWDRKQDDDDNPVAPLIAVTLPLGALLAEPDDDNDASVYDELEGFGEW